MRRLENWIQAYLVYTAESQSPEEFHRWVAISTIASALQRRVWVDLSYFTYYPNMYIVLVSPAGRCKKSTAMSIARGILRNVPQIHFSVDSTSRERLVRDMITIHKEGQSPLTVHSSEFASFFATSGMNMVGFLTDIFDSPLEWIHRTESGGDRPIKSPCLNLIAGTTPDWIASAMPLDTIGIGLTSRIVFIYQDQPRIKPMIPKLTPAQRQIRELLQHDLLSITMMQGEYKLTPDAYHWYDEEWGLEYQRAGAHHTDSRLAGYFERKPTHLIKLAMAVAASQRNDLVITVDDFIAALSMLEYAETNMPKVFAHVGRNPLAFDHELVAAAIQSSGTITFGQLLTQFQHNLRLEELQEVLSSLLTQGRIVQRGAKYSIT